MRLSAYPDFEVVSINGGRRDDTVAILDALVDGDPRLCAVHLARDHGEAMAFTAGALFARHEILLCIDGDALLNPTRPLAVSAFRRVSRRRRGPRQSAHPQSTDAAR